MFDECMKPRCPTCVPLAVIRDYSPGMEITEDMIDNREYRVLLPSTTLLDQLLRCILEKLPARKLTSITEFNWTHGKEYHSHDFMKLFGGEEGFEVTFGEPVREDGLSRRSFQAVVVKYPEKAGKGGSIEVVPSKVWASHDRRRFHLKIDRGYAEHWLQGSSFDLYITLHCNFIVDECGRPVDGDLLAQLQSDGSYMVAAPTGNGIPGGKFESWIRVIP